jgi:uncharacterized protein
MVRILLLSDTHGFLDQAISQYAAGCDEIWHGGDFGSQAVIDDIRSLKPLRGVYGNIDDPAIRQQFPERLLFDCEAVRVAMVHIGGYPGKYAPGVKKWLKSSGAKLFVSGHSHILKAMPDPELSCLHLNPGAAGWQGWHQVRTWMRFTVDGDKISNLEVIELGPKRKT